ncbi:MAG: hypothetical protein ABIP11_03255 [Luteimonas sp.]
MTSYLHPRSRQSDPRTFRLGGFVVRGLVLAVLLAVCPVAAIAGTGLQMPSAGVAIVGVSRVPAESNVTEPSVSSEVAYVAGWVSRTSDNGGMPYIIIDKVNAKVFVFDARWRFQGAAPALLGMEHGDGSAPGLGARKMSAIRPTQRTTPAGRYVASLGRDLHGGDILWIDYANAIALHRVVKGTPAEHRAQRLESETSQDNRISYGCINVPVKFYESIVSPEFANTNGVVYILPEMSPAREMFKSPGVVGARAQATLPAASVQRHP